MVTHTWMGDVEYYTDAQEKSTQHSPQLRLEIEARDFTQEWVIV